MIYNIIERYSKMRLGCYSMVYPFIQISVSLRLSNWFDYYNSIYCHKGGPVDTKHQKISKINNIYFGYKSILVPG